MPYLLYFHVLYFAPGWLFQTAEIVPQHATFSLLLSIFVISYFILGAGDRAGLVWGSGIVDYM